MHHISLQFEIVRVFVCTTGIHIRLTRMKFELLTTPFLHQFEAAVSTRAHLQDEVERMTAFIQPAVEAVENPDPRFTPNNSTKETEPSDPDIVTGAEYVQRYREKLYTQCLFQIRETQRVCIQNYSHLYFECVERVSLIQSYCAVFKVENYCSISKVTRSVLYWRKVKAQSPFFVSDRFWVNARILLRHNESHPWAAYGGRLPKVN